METAEAESHVSQYEQPTPPSAAQDQLVPIEPDLDFIKELINWGGATFQKCFQCGTCSAVCQLSPEFEPFPRKEMAWASWGMKDRLLSDPDVWLCYHCSDCTASCPRSARPGDLLAEIRRQSVLHYATPRILGKAVNKPILLPFLLGIPAMLLAALAFLGREPVEKALGIATQTSDRIVYSYSSFLPQWLLFTFFGVFAALIILPIIVGVLRFWRAMKSVEISRGTYQQVKGLGPSMLSGLKKILLHSDFKECTVARSRLVSHMAVFYGFLGLSAVTIWVMTARYNPLINEAFVYPLNFWDPWRILANLAGIALIAGCLMMIQERLSESDESPASTFFDWAFLGTLLAVALTGFASEALHYLRMEPHRHVIYFGHLVLVFSLLIYLPYSKFAHVFYRSTAMVFAEHTGRNKKIRVVGEE